MKTALALLLTVSISVNIYLSHSLSKIHIQPRRGKDVGLEMKNQFTGSFDEVILVYGYLDNYAPAKEIVEFAEKTSGRPAGSFRIKTY